MKVLCAAACVGIAAWCSLGALGIAGASAVSARVALLPPWWLLAVLVAASWTLLRALRFSSAELSPFFVSALLILPWLPVPLPAAALLWTGAFVPAVWAAAALGVIVARRRTVQWRWVMNPRRTPIVVGALAIALYGATAWWLSPRVPVGDEPHYLVITQSLLKDGDLRIENNHQRGDYLEYFSGPLRPDYLRRGSDGAIYSIHAPGLPTVVLPAFWLLGYAGAVAFLALVAAIGTALVWRIGYDVTGSVPAAWFGWACCAVTAPFLFLATQVYPDGIGATLVLLGLLPVLDQRTSARSWLVSSVALATLPWLHTRFAVLSGVAALVVAVRLRSFRRILAFSAIPAVSAAAWFGYFLTIYGTASPSAPYGHYTQTATGNLVQGIPGLLFDQQFGLIASAPVYGFVLAGLVLAAVRGRRWPLDFAVVIVPYVVAVGMYHMWWGGTSVPARFLTPLSLVLGVGAARIWHETRVPLTHALAGSLLAVSVFIGAVLLVPDHGRLLFNFRDGFALWLEWSNDLLDLPRGLPSLFRDTPQQAWFKTGLWIASGAAGWILLHVTARRDADERAVARRLAWIMPLYLAGAAMLAFSLVWSIDGVQPLTPETAEMSLVVRADPRLRPVAYDYAARRFETPRELMPRLRLRPSGRRPTGTNAPLLAVPRVPAGTHRLHIATSGSVEGSLVLRVGRDSPPLDVWQLSDTHASPQSRLIHFPVEVQSMYIEADDRARRTISHVSLELWVNEAMPIAVAPGTAGHAAQYGSALVYFLGTGAFAEPQGFWLEGGSQVRLVVSNGGAPLRFFLRNAPVQNTITIEVDGYRHAVELRPGEETTLEIPKTRTMADVLVRFQTSAGFRPSEGESRSTDVRYLGCWVEMK